MVSFFESIYGPWGLWTAIRIVVDVGLIVFLCYKAFCYIRGTRAVPLLNGIIALAVAYVLARMAGLKGIQYLLDRAFLAAAVALPVIFQPELRRALEKIGHHLQIHPLMRLGEMQEPDLPQRLRPIIEAARQLQEHRIGGLMVLERNTGLNEYIATGVLVDAEVTPELLTTLFAPNMPLHDGAVIIRGSRIVAAACWLPLTDKPLPHSLGTRHRAAVGISEQSDAIAVVVSEETGKIAVAYDGRLIENLTGAEQLQKTLEVLIPMQPRSQSRWATFGQRNRAAENTR